MATEQSFRENVVRAVAVVGLVAVLVLGAWGIIQLAFVIPNFFNNLASQTPAPVATTTPTQTTTTTKPTQTTTTRPAATKPAATKPAPTKTAKPASTYYASGRTTNLFGYPDLQVRLVSAPASVRAGELVTITFVVENVGTNVASGWSFVGHLPYSPVYDYPSGVQQALYPGDKIVYTLSYSAQYNQNTQTYCDGWSWPCTTPAPIYGGPGTCNAYGPCNIPGYNANIYGYNYYYGGQTSATIQVDPYNLVWELNEGNNRLTVPYSVY